MSTVAVGIMAHPSRAADAHLLALGHGDGVIAWDEGAGENATGDAAWAETAELARAIGADWTIVLQDDALPVDNFREHAAAALEHAPATAVSFYVGTGRPMVSQVVTAVHQAADAGHSWLRYPGMLWGVAVAMPTEMVEGYLRWSPLSREAYDRRIGIYFQRRGLESFYTSPSLVDHNDGPTIAHNRQPRVQRRAHLVGIPETWDTGSTRIPARGSRAR